METVDIKALVAFGKVGFALAASKVLSLMALGGLLALSFYVAYNPTVTGAACVGIVAFGGFIPALMAERSPEARSGKEGP